MNHRIKSMGMATIALASAVWTGGLLGGCGDTRPGPNPTAEADRLKVAMELRSYFTKANGDYSNLSEQDKAAFAKLAGGESKAESTFNAMKTPVRPKAQAPSGASGQ